MQLFVSLIAHHRVLTISIERIIIASAISLPLIYSTTPEITATTSSTIIIKLLNCATNVCHKEVWASEVPHKVFCLNFWGHFKTSPPLTNGDIGEGILIHTKRRRKKESFDSPFFCESAGARTA